MPFVAGISLVSLDLGSPISVELLSHEDEKYTHTSEAKVGESLQTTFEQVASAIPEKPVQVTLSLPSYFTEAEKGSVITAAKAVGLVVARTLDNIQTVQRGLAKEAYAPQNELVLEIGPSAAGARLMSTEVEEGIRMSDVAKEIFLKEAISDPAALISKLVDPLLAFIKEIPTASGSELKRIVIISFSPNVAPPLVDLLKAKFAEEGIEILVEFSIARYAADISLYFYRDSIAEKFVFNVAPLRVGIAKADGFVLTVIPRSHTLPQHQTALLTTSKDDQTKVTVQVVVGVSPRAKENTSIAELVLEGLAPRPKGVPRIRVTIDVEQMGKTSITAEEILEGGVSGINKSVDLKDVTSDTLTWDDVEVILEKLPTLKKDDEAEEAENQWVAEEAQGALPE